MWSRLPNTNEEAEDCDVGIFMKTDGGTVESLDYEVLENCAYRQEQAQRGKLYMYYSVGVKWFFALLIGIGTATSMLIRMPYSILFWQIRFCMIFMHPHIITTAEDATLYPGLSKPISQGGLGFDYFVNLSAPDMWLSLIQNVPDQEWSMSKIVSTLVGNRQTANKMLLYAENHNQSISGGQSFAELLFGANVDSGHAKEESLLRGCSLNKMIRLITFTIGGSAYLNFMGNEFGHPQRVEFPLPSNNFSFALAKRRWDLLSEDGVHSQLFSFDKDMMNLDKVERILSKGSGSLPKIHHVNDSTMVIAYIRGPFLFVFNFHPTNSYESYSIGVEEAGEYQVILNTDDKKYGGQGLIGDDQYVLKTVSKRVDGMRISLEMPLPSRTAQVHKLIRILRV